MATRKYPEMCYVFVESEACIGIVKWGEKGYYQTKYEAGRLDNEKLAKELNKKLGVSENEADTMKLLSMNDKIDGDNDTWKVLYDDIISKYEAKRNNQ